MSADTDTPLTVLELFQSQGCSSCPPANTNILNLLSNPNYLVLTYDVTYWDYLGWKDTFGNKAWDDRQKDYARVFRTGRLYTPQVIVNGRVDGVGSRSGELDKLIRAGIEASSGVARVRVQVDSAGRVVTISGIAENESENHNRNTSKQVDGALVLMVRYDAKLHHVDVTRGENSGRTLPHQNVVRSVTQIGTWHGPSPQTFSLTSTDHNTDIELHTAILIQDGEGGPVLGAAKVA